jgi:uncharacterized membrane protein
MIHAGIVEYGAILAGIAESTLTDFFTYGPSWYVILIVGGIIFFFFYWLAAYKT